MKKLLSLALLIPFGCTPVVAGGSQAGWSLLCGCTGMGGSNELGIQTRRPRISGRGLVGSRLLRA